MLVALVALATVTSAGVAPLAALPYVVAPFGTSYTAHSINHALAAPIAVPAAAPLAAAPLAAAPLAAAPLAAAPLAAAPLAAASLAAAPLAAAPFAAAPAVYAPHGDAYFAG